MHATCQWRDRTSWRTDIARSVYQTRQALALTIGCAGLAREGLLEFGHVLHDAVDAESGGRMRVGLHLQPQRFIALIARTRSGRSQEEALLGGEAVDLRRASCPPARSSAP